MNKSSFFFSSKIISLGIRQTDTSLTLVSAKILLKNVSYTQFEEIL